MSTSKPARSEARLVRVRLIGAAAAALSLGAGAHAQAPAGKTPSFTAAQAKRGADIYAANCAMCHGDNLDDGQFAPPLKGPAHATYWQGKTAADLLTYASTMMPPTQPGGLGAQAYADVYARMLQSAGATPGDKELPADPAALKGDAPTR